MQNQTILAVGYSVRALVEACSRVGYPSIAVDHFGDADTLLSTCGNWIPLELTDEKLLAESSLIALQTIATAHRNTGRSLVALLGGGMENLPHVVAQLNAFANVLGPDTKQLEHLRDYLLWQSAAQAAAVGFPAVTNKRALDESNRDWLWKPRTNAGGLQIGWDPPANSGTASGVWQQFITGRQIGATCIAHTTATEYIGATLSFAAEDWPGPTEFIYRGSYGPHILSDVQQQQVVDVAEYFRRQIGVRGWLQFDFIEDSLGDLWLLECNPRWTAGMEIFILAGNLQLVEKHLAATNAWEDRENTCAQPYVTGCIAKAIVYATQDLQLTQPIIDRMLAQRRQSGTSFSWLADIPSRPQLVPLGHPLATVRCQVSGQVAAESVGPVLRHLRERLLGISVSSKPRIAFDKFAPCSWRYSRLREIDKT